MLSWKSFWNTNWHLQAFFSYSYFNPHFFALNHFNLLLLVSPFFSPPPPPPFNYNLYGIWPVFEGNDCTPQILLFCCLYLYTYTYIYIPIPIFLHPHCEKSWYFNPWLYHLAESQVWNMIVLWYQVANL